MISVSFIFINSNDTAHADDASGDIDAICSLYSGDQDTCVSSITNDKSKENVCKYVLGVTFNPNDTDTDCYKAYNAGSSANDPASASANAEAIVNNGWLGNNQIGPGIVGELAYYAANSSSTSSTSGGGSSPPVTSYTPSQAAQDFCNSQTDDMVGGFLTACEKGYDNPNSSTICSDGVTAAQCVIGQNGAKAAPGYAAAQVARTNSATCSSKYPSSTTYTYYNSGSKLTATQEFACETGANATSATPPNTKICTTYFVDASGKQVANLVAACQYGWSKSAVTYCDNTDPTKCNTELTCQNASGHWDDTAKKCSKVTTSPESTCMQKGGVLASIMCPVLEAISQTFQDLFKWILNSLFQYDGIANDGLRSSWQNFLPIANILLVIVFLVLIYSVATNNGFGAMSNYDVKKILPRLLLVAIAINTSFYICAAIVDLSNIIGASVGSFIGNANGTAFSDLSDLALASIAIIVVCIVAWPTMLLSLLMIVILVVARKVIITVLIVISPIAFALWLLPNTAKWSKKWLNEFVRMLFIYPAISAVFGAAMLTSTIVKKTGNGFDFLITPLLMIVPAIAILPLMKMGGQIMGQVSGLANKATFGARDKYRQSAMGQQRKREHENENAGIRGGVYQGKNPLKHLRAAGNKGANTLMGTRVGRTLGWQKTGRGRELGGAKIKSDAEEEEIGWETAKFQQDNRDNDVDFLKQTAMADPASAKGRAATRLLAAHNNADELVDVRRAAEAKGADAQAAYQRDVSSQYAALKGRNAMAVKEMTSSDWGSVTAPQIGAMSQAGQEFALSDLATVARLAKAAGTNQAFRDNFQEGNWRNIAAKGGAAGAAAQRILNSYYAGGASSAATPATPTSTGTPTGGTPTGGSGGATPSGSAGGPQARGGAPAPFNANNQRNPNSAPGVSGATQGPGGVWTPGPGGGGSSPSSGGTMPVPHGPAPTGYEHLDEAQFGFARDQARAEKDQYARGGARAGQQPTEEQVNRWDAIEHEEQRRQDAWNQFKPNGGSS